MLKRLFAKWFSSGKSHLPHEPTPSHLSQTETDNPTCDCHQVSPPTPTSHETSLGECEATITETGEIDFCGLMLEQTIETHRTFVKELRAVLGGKMPEAYSPEVIGAEDACKLGQWLFNEGKSLAKYPAYAEVLKAHRAFHACAADVVRLHQKQEFALAIKLLTNDLKALSEQVEAALLQLHEQAQAAKLANGGNLCD